MPTFTAGETLLITVLVGLLCGAGVRWYDDRSLVKKADFTARLASIRETIELTHLSKKDAYQTFVEKADCEKDRRDCPVVKLEDDIKAIRRGVRILMEKACIPAEKQISIEEGKP